MLLRSCYRAARIPGIDALSAAKPSGVAFAYALIISSGEWRCHAATAGIG